MKTEILYLFNSSLRPVYRENLYRILALPTGGVTQFRYSADRSVPPELKNGSLQGSACLIVFIDRFSAGSYTYYPIRMGEVLNTSVEGNRFFLECRLGDYCTADEPEHFTQALRQSVDGLPQLTDGDPENINDGYYVQLGQDLRDDLIAGVECWTASVEKIRQTKSLAEDSKPFLRISVSTGKTGETNDVVPRADGILTLKAGESYVLHIFYLDPGEGAVPKDVDISFQWPLKRHEPTGFTTGALTDRVGLSFETDQVLRTARTSVCVTVQKNEPNSYTVLLPVTVSSIHLLMGTIFYGLVICLLILTEKTLFQSSTFWSTVAEFLKWCAAFRVLIVIGRLPNLPTQ